MADRRTHRGPHPEDAELFAPERWPVLRIATMELVWLLSRGYTTASALKLVGDRHELQSRQRTAVARCSCADEVAARRRAREMDVAALQGCTLWIDGHNLLTTIEAALGGAVLLLGHDGCMRDMASMHGSYRRVEETRPALVRIGRATTALGIAACHWLLDAPVSNSGRLKGLIREIAASHEWNWSVELVPDPDRLLARAAAPVATADSAVIDAGPAWFNLARWTVEHLVPEAYVVDLRPTGE